MSPFTLMQAAATFGCGLLAGLFFVFSNFAMPSLDTLPPQSAIKAMQEINERILNPLFLALFGGTALLSAALLGVTLYHGVVRDEALLIGGATAYLFGVFFVTIAWNVPLNESLKAIESTAGTAEEWQRYYQPWLVWNHVRTVCSFIAFAFFLLSR